MDNRYCTGNPGRIELSATAGDNQQHFADEGALSFDLNLNLAYSASHGSLSFLSVKFTF
jgi:hypothetical protein